MNEDKKFKRINLTKKYFPSNFWELWVLYFWYPLKLKYLKTKYFCLLNKSLSEKTSYGTTIYDCCKAALRNPQCNVGTYAQGNNNINYSLNSHAHE